MLNKKPGVLILTAMAVVLLSAGCGKEETESCTSDNPAIEPSSAVIAGCSAPSNIGSSTHENAAPAAPAVSAADGQIASKDQLDPEVFSSSGADLPHLLLRSKEYLTRLMIPEGEESIILQFPEEMNTNFLPAGLNSNTSIIAKWLDGSRLQIDLTHAVMLPNGSRGLDLSIKGLQSKSGKPLDKDSQGLHISLTPSYSWKLAGSGSPYGFSSLDRFYDLINPSPAQDSYVGLVRLGGASGDGDGTSYAIVLERKGKKPLLVEDVFYSTIEPGGSPVQWADENTLVYSSYFGVFAYDVQTGKKTTIQANGTGEEQNLNYAVYDTAQHSLHVLAYSGRSVSASLDRFTYKDWNKPPAQEKAFTETTLAGKYSHLDMTITPVGDGSYWTRLVNGLPVTEFRTDAGGKEFADGVVIAQADQGVYLQHYQEKNEMISEKNDFAYWQRGRSAVSIAKPPEAIMVFGWNGELIARMDQGSAYSYNRETDTWEQWKSPSGEASAQPVRGTDGLYRVKAGAAGQ